MTWLSTSGWKEAKKFQICDIEKSLVLGGWVDGSESRFKDCLQHSKNKKDTQQNEIHVTIPSKGKDRKKSETSI